MCHFGSFPIVCNIYLYHIFDVYISGTKSLRVTGILYVNMTLAGLRLSTHSGLGSRVTPISTHCPSVWLLWSSLLDCLQLADLGGRKKKWGANHRV